jgi:hypothetical protein
VTKDDEIKRAHRAEAILRDDLYTEAWDAVRARLLTIMETATSDEATLRAKLCLGLLGDMRAHLARVVTDGKLAAEAIKMTRDGREWWQKVA